MPVVKAQYVNAVICNSWGSTHPWGLSLISGIVSPKLCWICKTACCLALIQHVNISIEELPIWQLPRQPSHGVLGVLLHKDQATRNVTTDCVLLGM